MNEDAQAKNLSQFRWVICALLFFATTINYMDRQIIGVLKPTIQQDLHWRESDYANIVACFQIAYAAGGLLAGRLIDRIGVRLGYFLAALIWSFAAMGHAAVRTVPEFSAARFGLGFAEAGNFPAAVKTVGEWFPASERALATGIFNAGSNVGAMVTPLIVPFIVKYWGWHAAFLFTGFLGLFWVIAWAALYRNPARVAQADQPALAEPPLVPEPETTRPGWINLLRRRSARAYIISGMITGQVWWFYLYWVPDFLHKRFGLDLLHSALPLAVIYLMSDVGSVAGGWISSHLIARRWSINSSRKTALFICAIAVVPVCLVSITTNAWTATVLIGIAAAAHQGWNANMYTFVTDTTPLESTSSVVGMSVCAGGIAGMVVAKIVGYVLDATGSYRLLFLSFPFFYLIALLIVHLYVPNIDAEQKSR